jgi:hypothetical protein
MEKLAEYFIIFIFIGAFILFVVYASITSRKNKSKDQHKEKHQ